MDVMSVQDAVFLDVENGNNPMHIGSVAVLDGPAAGLRRPGPPHRREAAARAAVPAEGAHRARCDSDGPSGSTTRISRSCTTYATRRFPPPGGRDELRNLAGRVFAQVLDRSKPLWELWMVEGLEDGRWAIISKVHHCMVDGVAATDLLTVLFERPIETPEEVEPSRGVAPGPRAGQAETRGPGVVRTWPIRSVACATSPVSLQLTAAPMTRIAQAATLVRSLSGWGKKSATSLNGPIGPHRRWSWAEASLDDVKIVRAELGGTVNDVVLASITAGFRALLEHRGEDLSNRVVRTLVPVSVRADHERGAINNRVSGMFPGLPVSIDDPAERLASISEQLSMLKELQAGSRRRRARSPRRVRASDAARRWARGSRHGRRSARCRP